MSDDVECLDQFVALFLGHTPLPVNRLGKLFLGEKLRGRPFRSSGFERVPENAAHMFHRSVSHDFPLSIADFSYFSRALDNLAFEIGYLVSTLDSKPSQQQVLAHKYQKCNSLSTPRSFQCSR